MKRLLSALFLVAALPLSASAKVNIDIGIKIGLPGVIIGIDSHGFMRHSNGRVYVNTPKVCGITAVKLHVSGDNLYINDFDVLFGNGEVQDIPTRGHFRKDSDTVWKDVNGVKRCIIGFSVKATPDFDWRSARVTVIGMQSNGWAPHQVRLGSALIRDFYF